MGQVWVIVRKDLVQRLRDRSAVLFAVIVPLGLAVLFGGLFGDFGSGSLGTLRYGVVDQDGGDVAVLFTDEVLPAVSQELDLELSEFDTEEAATEAIDAGDLDAVFVIPPDFSSTVRLGQGARLLVLKNADRQLAGDVAGTIADGFTTRLTGTQVAVAAALSSGVPPEQAPEVAQRASQIIAPVRLVDGLVDNQTLDTPTYLSAGMAVFFLFFTVQLGVISYLEERQQGTLARVLAAPLRRSQVVVAKGLTSFLIGVIATAILVVATALLVGADWGDPLGVAVLVVGGVLSATIIVSLVSFLARTAEQANVWQSIFAIVLGMLGGAFFPVVNGPGLLARLSLITPHAWFLRGLGTLRGGGGAVDVLPAAGAMLLFPLGLVVVGLLAARIPAVRRMQEG